MDDGTVIHYRLRRAGNTNGSLLILIHGLASNLTRWSEFVEHTSLRDRHDILWLDLRGHGESTVRAPIGMRIWCDDLVSILDAEKYEQATVIGHSLGAQVALHFADRYPARVNGLVLIDPVFRKALRGTARWLSYLTPIAWLVIGLIRFLNALGLRRRAIPNRDLRRLDEETRSALIDSGRYEEMIRRYTSPLEDLRYFPAANYLQEYLELIRPVPLEQIVVPVLVLLSSGLTFTDLGLTRRAVARFKDAEIVMIKAYHWPLTEKPKEVRGAIERWCARRLY